MLPKTDLYLMFGAGEFEVIIFTFSKSATHIGGVEPDSLCGKFNWTAR